MLCEIVANTENLPYEEWLKLRKSGIGGSDVSSIFGVSRYKTLRDLYYEKTDTKKAIEDNKSWVQKEYGKIVEPFVAKIFSAKTGYKLFKDSNMYVHKINRFMNANIDFFIEMPDGTINILECKTCSFYSKNKWNNDEIPLEYELQVRHYMAVTDIDKAYIACLYDNNESSLIIREVYRDLEFEKHLIETEKKFWYENVLKRIEPPYIEDGECSLASYKKYEYELNKKDEIIIPKKEILNISEYLALDKQISELKKQAKELENKQKKCQVNILLNMQNYQTGKLGYGNSEYTVQNSVSDRNGVDTDMLKYKYPDVYKEVRKTSKVNKFKIETSNKPAF